MLDRIVGPREIARHEAIPLSEEQTWLLIEQWARSVGLELVERDGTSRVYAKQRGAVAQLRHVIRTVVGQPRLDGVDSVTFTVSTRNIGSLAPAVIEVDRSRQDNLDIDPTTELIIRVDRSTQRETTSWTGGGIIVGGSAMSAYLANSTSLWLWLAGVPVAAFIGSSYFRDRKKSLEHMYADVDVTVNAIAAGERPKRQRDALLQKMRMIRGSQ